MKNTVMGTLIGLYCSFVVIVYNWAAGANPIWGNGVADGEYAMVFGWPLLAVLIGVGFWVTVEWLIDQERDGHE